MNAQATWRTKNSRNVMHDLVSAFQSQNRTDGLVSPRSTSGGLSHSATSSKEPQLGASCLRPDLQQ